MKQMGAKCGNEEAKHTLTQRPATSSAYTDTNTPHRVIQRGCVAGKEGREMEPLDFRAGIPISTLDFVIIPQI